MSERDYWTEIIRGAGIILKAMAARYLGKKLNISAD